MKPLFVPIVLIALLASACTNAKKTLTIDVTKPPDAKATVPAVAANNTPPSERSPTPDADAAPTPDADVSPTPAGSMTLTPAPTLSVAGKTTVEDTLLSFVGSDVQASEEAQGANAKYEFDQASTTGTRCSDHGVISAMDSATGAFDFMPAANWNGSCNIRVGFDNGSGASVESIFAVSVSAIADPPTTPTSVTLSPTTADSSSTLTCTPAGALDPDGDAISYEHRWYVNMALVTGQTASTLTTGFAKGQGVHCEARSTDLLLQSAYVASSVVTIQNSAPVAPSTVTITSATPTREGSFSCGYTGGSDADADLLTHTYAWAVNGTTVAGQNTATLSGSNMNVVKGSTVTCRVSLSDGTSSSSTVSAGTTVLNSAITQTCTWSGGAIGASYTLTVGDALSTKLVCGSNDSDANDTPVWSVSGCASNFTINASSGALSGAMLQSQCTLGVTVSDGTASATTSVQLVPQGGANPPIAGRVFSVAAHPDGDVLLGGDFTAIGGEAADRMLVLEANGDRDTRFLGFDGEVRDVHAYADGRLLVIGDFRQYGTTPVPGIAKLNADGSLDTAFISNLGLANDQAAYSLDVHAASGRIYIAGRFDNWNGVNLAGVVALNADGTRHTNFYPGNGTIASNGTESAWTAVHDLYFDPSFVSLDQANESVYVSGNFNTFNGLGAKNLARFDSRGYLDQRFTKAVGPNNEPESIQFNNVTGKLILAGNIDDYAGEDTDNNEVLYISNTNTIDTSVQAAKGHLWCSRRIRIEPVSGDVFVFGCWDDIGTSSLQTHSGYVRLTASGAIAASTLENSDDSVEPLDGFIDASGRTVLIGNVRSWNGTASTSQGLLRVTSAGSLDTSFDVGGGIPIGPNGWDIDMKLIEPMPNGRVVVAGKFRSFRNITPARTIAKFNPLTGVIDTAFMANAHSERVTRAIVVDSANSKIYFGGDFDSFSGSATYQGLARTNLAGQVDAGYVVGQAQCFDVYAMALAPAYSGDVNVLNDLYVLGNLKTSCGAGESWGIWRLNSDATKDTNFTSNQFSSRDWGTGVYTLGQSEWWDDSNWRGYDMAFDTNTGRLYATGPISKYASRVTEGVVAIASNGSVVANAGFVIDSGIRDHPERVLLSGSDVLIAGRFDRFRDLSAGDNATGLLRVTSAGADVFAMQNDPWFDPTDMVLQGTTLYLVGSFSDYQSVGVSQGIVAVDAASGTQLGAGAFSGGTGFDGGRPRFLVKTTINSTPYLFVYGAISTYRGNSTNGSALIGLDGSFVH